MLKRVSGKGTGERENEKEVRGSKKEGAVPLIRHLSAQLLLRLEQACVFSRSATKQRTENSLEKKKSTKQSKHKNENRGRCRLERAIERELNRTLPVTRDDSRFWKHVRNQETCSSQEGPTNKTNKKKTRASASSKNDDLRGKPQRVICVDGKRRR